MKYYGNSYKENYNVVIPANEEEFWVIVYSEKDSGEEQGEQYDNFNDARFGYKYMVEQDSGSYDYVVLQHIIKDDVNGEIIEEVDTWGIAEKL